MRRTGVGTHLLIFTLGVAVGGGGGYGIGVYLATQESEKTSEPERRQVSPGLSPERRAAWRKLKKRMDEDEVRKLLGEPGRITVTDYSGTVWAYHDGGVITLGVYGVTGWREP